MARKISASSWKARGQSVKEEISAPHASKFLVVCLWYICYMRITFTLLFHVSVIQLKNNYHSFIFQIRKGRQSLICCVRRIRLVWTCCKVSMHYLGCITWDALLGRGRNVRGPSEKSNIRSSTPLFNIGCRGRQLDHVRIHDLWSCWSWNVGDKNSVGKK